MAVDPNQIPMTNYQIWDLSTKLFQLVISTLLVILAIWGETIRAKLLGPKLVLELHDPQGIITTFNSGQRTRYYHLKVKNKRRKSPAKNVRVVLTKVMRPTADGTWADQIISGPLQLQWQYPSNHPQYPSIGPEDICDLGYLVQNDRFYFSIYLIPNNFMFYLEANQRARIEVIAVADECESNTLTVEIAWNGQWSEDTLEMQRHLVVKKIDE